MKIASKERYAMSAAKRRRAWAALPAMRAPELRVWRTRRPGRRRIYMDRLRIPRASRRPPWIAGFAIISRPSRTPAPSSRLASAGSLAACIGRFNATHEPLRCGLRTYSRRNPSPSSVRRLCRQGGRPVERGKKAKKHNWRCVLGRLCGRERKGQSCTGPGFF